MGLVQRSWHSLLNAYRPLKKPSNHHFTYTEGLIGAVAMDKYGSPLPKETLIFARPRIPFLFGTIGTLKYDDKP